MNRKVLIAAGAALAVAALSGCQTGAVDTTRTTSIGDSHADGSASDLAEGKAQFRSGNYGLAEQHFRSAVELNASSSEAWLGLAAAYDELGRFDFADRAYEQLLKLEGRRPRIINNMGYSQMLRGNKAKARELYMEARRGLSDTELVDANLALLSSGS